MIHQILELLHKSLLIAREIRHFLTIGTPGKLHIAIFCESHFVVFQRLFRISKKRIHLRIHRIFRIHCIDSFLLCQRIDRSIKVLFQFFRLFLFKQSAAQGSVLLFLLFLLLLLLLLRRLHLGSDHSHLPAVQTSRFFRGQIA